MEDKHFEYMVIKHTFTLVECSKCKGTGTTNRNFRKMNFVQDCPNCEGTGKEKLVHSIRVPLIKALEELNLLNQE
jgi:excinuclease UvrABC ATPase subunit